ncbi:hypothetical protein ACFQ6E_38840 [Streptomyces sp. NPDC056462]|uniref:hypothetical protein n=1 Tax=Streptomyces sp. NPDC056462 TaxID=3345826 RepID=UPI0036A6DD42
MPPFRLGLVFLALTFIPPLALAPLFRRPRKVGSAPSAIEVLVIAAVVTPFVSAFAAKIGEELGRRVTVITPRSWWRRRRQGDEVQVTVAGANASMFRVELGPDLTDEARLALIDLDVKRPELRGHLLHWSEDAKAWLPVPDTPGDS